jgi:hypothetical protein
MAFHPAENSTWYYDESFRLMRTKKPPLRINEKMVHIFNKDLQAINACGNLRQKLSIFYGPYDDVQPILYVRS